METLTKLCTMSMCVSRLPDDLPPCHRHDQGHRKVSRDSEGSRWVDRSYTLLLKLLARFDKYIFFIKYTKLLKGQSTRFSSSGPLSNSLKYVWFCFVTISPSYLNFSKSPLCLIQCTIYTESDHLIWSKTQESQAFRCLYSGKLADKNICETSSVSWLSAGQ